MSTKKPIYIITAVVSDYDYVDTRYVAWFLTLPAAEEYAADAQKWFVNARRYRRLPALNPRDPDGPWVSKNNECDFVSYQVEIVPPPPEVKS
jgi:hypothetical protein